MNNNFPRTLSLLRKERKISQRAAANELGVSQAVLSHYENGVREPGLEFVVRAAEFYHVTTDFLLGRTMSRDDYTIKAEEVPDISEEKGNVLRGSMMALLSKKLLVNSCGLIFDILGKSKNKQIVSDAAMYLNAAVYKVFRLIYSANGTHQEEFFSVPETAWSELTNAEMNLCEMRLRNALLEIGLDGDNAEPTQLPEISQEFLQKEHPELLQSLLSVLQTVGKRLNEHL